MVDDNQTAPGYWRDLVEHAKRGLERDKNPLHIWWLVHAAVQQAEIEHLQKWDLPLSERQELARDATPLPIPRWAWDYLAAVAWRLGELAEGRDWRKRPHAGPETVIDPSKPETMEPWESYRDTLTASPEKAAKLVPEALYLRRKGKNAFKDWHSAKNKRIINEEVNEKIRKGAKKSSALIQTMEEYGYGDIDSFRRLVREGKHLWTDD